jgi:hypothetical protein
MIRENALVKANNLSLIPNPIQLLTGASLVWRNRDLQTAVVTGPESTITWRGRVHSYSIYTHYSPQRLALLPLEDEGCDEPEPDRFSSESRAICSCSQILCWYPIERLYSSASLFAIDIAFSPSVTMVSRV